MKDGGQTDGQLFKISFSSFWYPNPSENVRKIIGGISTHSNAFFINRVSWVMIPSVKKQW